VTFTAFSGLASPTISGIAVIQTNANTGMSGLPSTWRAFTRTNNGNNDPASGVSVTYNFGSPFDARAYDWLAVAVVPRDREYVGQIDISVGEDSMGSPSGMTVVGSTYDVPPAVGSPNLVWCYLGGVPSSVRDSLRYIRFSLVGSFGGKFAVYGYAFFPAMPLQSPEKYYVSFQNSATLQESKLTEALEVTVTDADKSYPLYPNCYLDNATFKNNAGDDDPLSTANRRIFNREAGKSMPTKDQLGALITVSGTTPAVTGPDTVRLWKETQNGIRLVNTAAYPGASSAYAIIDTGGLGTLANTKYKAGGVGPRCSALAAKDGRLVAGYENRLYISSFTPTATTSTPFPQWPDVAIEDSDGWSFDLAPANTEQILTLANGDAMYIGTNQATYVMQDLAAPILGERPSFYLLFNRGVVSRRGSIFRENRYFWASHDGVYSAANRSNVVELSEDIRRVYVDWLLPDSTLVMAYKDRVLWVVRGAKYLRYSFVTGRWARGSFANTVEHFDGWRDPTGTVEECWLFLNNGHIGRLQASATSDLMVDSTAGTAIPDWEYSTGFDVPGVQSRVRYVAGQVDGAVEVSVCKTTSNADLTNLRRIVLSPSNEGNEDEQPSPADLRGLKFRVRITGKSTTTCKRLMWERDVLGSKGG
jgi:hypothetical protein